MEGPTTANTGIHVGSFGGFGDFNIDAVGIPGGRFTVKENGRVGIGIGSPQHPLHMSDGAFEDGGTWHNNSDRNLRANFSPVNGQQLLVKLNRIPVLTWNYKADGRSRRHLGPMAQDFHAAFGLAGEDDKHISTDEGGVALAGVQELYRMILKKDKEIRTLEQLTREKDAQLQKLTAEVERLQSLEQAVQILSAKMANIEAGRGAVRGSFEHPSRRQF